MKYLARNLIAAVTGLVCSAASAAPVIILSGEVNGQGPGSLIEETPVISIPTGAVLVFNDPTGQTQTIAGPFEGPINADRTADTAPASGLDRLIASRSAEQSLLGAIRTAPGLAPTEAELISIAQSSVQCLASGVKARLWRPETLNADSFFKVTHANSGAVAGSVWHDGTQQVDWPSEVPLISGAHYRVELEIAPRPVEITLFLAPRTFDTDTDLASWMGRVGCRRQAFALLDRIID
ncbi:MAG: hypothetical protein ACFB03_00845 [Paracoccaceae bacterium]